MSETFSMTVEIFDVGETQEFGDKGFKKRQLVGTVVDGQYTNYFAFDFVQDKVDLLDAVFEGQQATVHYNIRCRRIEKKGKDDQYFTSLSAWKIEV